MPSRRSVLGGIAAAPLTAATARAAGAATSTRAKAGALALRLRTREEIAPSAGRYAISDKPELWDPKRTAAIVVDMWDTHASVNAARRVTELAPRMNTVVEALRGRGVFIINAPSDCMATYEDHPGRRRARAARRPSTLPVDIDKWCRHIPNEDRGTYPVDQSDGGSDDDPAEREPWLKKLAAAGRDVKLPWRRQHEALRIADGDAISDKGVEIWSLLAERRIGHVLIMGVHTNMCVLGRPFGLRQMVKNGKRAALVRDLTDTMYNPARPPHVSHFTGTDLIVEHIEKFVAPTIESSQLVGGAPFRFAADRRPRVTFLIDEDEYKTESTLPAFALKHLGRHFKTMIVHGRGSKEHSLPGMESLDDTDVVVVSVRRRFPLPDELAALRRHVAAGKPVIGIRTASHAFALRSGEPPAGRAAWQTFDPDVLGGNYQNHHGAGPKTAITRAQGATDHPVLRGLDPGKLVGNGSLYRVSPLVSGTQPLLIGTAANHPAEPVAWTHVRADGGRSFYTSLGHPDDFTQPAFEKFLANAVFWAAGIDAPAS